jgi:opacity protein-like surface antigen
MGNLFYDFNAGGVIVPYIGAGAGVAFINGFAGGGSSNSTQFAYQGILGVGWNINETVPPQPGRPLLRNDQPDRQ